MKITKKVLRQINDCAPNTPPEIGGILGSSGKGIITDIVFDITPLSNNKVCYYAPNVDYLNKCIKEWHNADIEFEGVFHIHFAGVKTLSCADKKYINAIMKNMPEEITYLYFPVFVLPDRELVCYKAEKANKEIKICYENVIYI